MPNDDVDGLGLAEAIMQIKAGLAAAQTADAPGGIRLPMESVTVELKVIAAKEGNAKAGFKVPVIDLELSGGGTMSREQTHTITVVFGLPKGPNGQPISIDKSSDDPGI